MPEGSPFSEEQILLLSEETARRLEKMGEAHAEVINRHVGTKHLIKGLAVPLGLVATVSLLAFWQVSDTHNKEIFFDKAAGSRAEKNIEVLTANHASLNNSILSLTGEVHVVAAHHTDTLEQLKVINRRLDAKGIAKSSPQPSLPDGIHATIGKMPVKKQEYSVNGVPKDEECDPDK